MEKNRWLGALIVLLVIIAGWHLIGELWAFAGRFADIILLFFLAWLLAFVLNPVAKVLTHLIGLPRLAGVLIVYLGLVLVIFGSIVLLIPVITLQLSQIGASLGSLADELPGWTSTVQAELTRRDINIDLSSSFGRQELSAQIERVGTMVIQNAIGILTGLASALFSMVLVIVLSFYMLADGSRLLQQLVAVVPRHLRVELQFLLASVERTFGGFILGQIIQCTIYGLGTAVIMLGGGLNYVLVASLFAGISMMVPFIGPAVALVPPVVIALAQGSVATAIVVAVALLVLQQVVINVVAPKVLSETVGLPPLLIILALLVGAKVAGLMGALFGVPVAAVIYAMLVFLYRRSALAESASAADGDAAWLDKPRASEGGSAAAWLRRHRNWINGRLTRQRSRQ